MLRPYLRRTLPRGLRVGLRAGACLGLCFPAALSGQPVEFDVGWSDVAAPGDDDPISGPAEGVDRLPPGFVIGARFAWTRTFLQLDAQYGQGEGDGSICDDIAAGDCPTEAVEYSSGLVALSFGVALRYDIAPDWHLRVRPRVGLGLQSASEKGVASERQHSESRLAALIGAQLDARTEPASRWIRAVGLFAGLDVVHPFAEDCLDCRVVLEGWMPRLSVGLTIAPGTGPDRTGLGGDAP